MIGLITIELRELHFYAYHGLYAEEKKTGNEFEVNIVVVHAPVSGTILDLAETINYVTLYDLIKKEMQQPRDLLETLVMELAEQVHAHFRGIKKVAIGITKLQPPIAHFTGKVCVSYTKEFN